MMRHPIVQGDILLIPVDNPPAGTSPVERDNRSRVILAEGEVTGHAHAVSSDACELVTADDADGLAAWYLLVAAPVKVEHEEHAAVTVDRGAWQVIRQSEYAPETLRNVQD
jgi:hypothetical protein